MDRVENNLTVLSNSVMIIAIKHDYYPIIRDHRASAFIGSKGKSRFWKKKTVKV